MSVGSSPQASTDGLKRTASAAALRSPRPRSQAQRRGLRRLAVAGLVAHDLSDPAGSGDADLERRARSQRALAPNAFSALSLPRRARPADLRSNGQPRPEQRSCTFAPAGSWRSRSRISFVRGPETPQRDRHRRRDRRERLGAAVAVLVDVVAADLHRPRADRGVRVVAVLAGGESVAVAVEARRAGRGGGGGGAVICTARVSEAVLPAASSAVMVTLYAPAAAKVCETAVPVALPPSPKLQQIVTGDQTSKTSAEKSSACPVCPAAGAEIELSCGGPPS